ncbi:MAG: ATP-binding cassette domain-containing protein [Pedobacter sp.]|nr:MAG: ATP-binding cassette domain-containing protein [Pedobacter sp.]
MSGLHIDSVSKHFGLRPILNDVFISCNVGDIIGLLGRNGSGKSTLMKIIFGSLDADYKYVRIDEKVIKNITDNRDLLQYLPQHSFLPTNVSIKRIISTLCNLEEALLLFKIDLIRPFLGNRSSELSGGELRLIESLILIYAKSKYVLLDEPFSGLAPLHVEIIKEHIKFMSRKKGFIITDHDYANVLKVSTSLILLQDGKTRKIDHPDQLVEYSYLPATAHL